MALPLTDNGKELVSWLPRFLQDDSNVQGVIDIISRETDLLDDSWEDVLDQLFVQTATWGLKYWERLLRFPEEPAGISVADRRVLILSKLKSSKVESGIQFRQVLDIYTTSYTITADAVAGTIAIDATFNPSDYTEAQLETIIRSIVPAHFSLTITYGGFIVGVNTAGDTL